MKAYRHFLRSPVFDVLQFLLLLMLMFLFFSRSVETMGYNWQWYQIPRYLYSRNESGFTAGPLLLALEKR